MEEGGILDKGGVGVGEDGVIVGVVLSSFFEDGIDDVGRSCCHGNPAEVGQHQCAARQGDNASEKAIQKLGKYLGIALASMAPVLAPDRVCIAGGISEAGEILLNATQTSFLKTVGPPYAEGMTILKALLGWRAVLVGAAEVQRKN